MRPIPLIVICCFAALLTACGDRIRNVGEAMLPTIGDGQTLPVDRNFAPLRRGDIIVFYYPLDQTKKFAKRIVGVPHDNVGIVNGVVTINGKPLDEPYVAQSNRSYDNFGPILIPPDKYFVLGDNRRNSSDSRHWGLVPESLIFAKVKR